MQIRIQCLPWGLGVCISNKLTDDAEIPVHGPHTEKALGNADV